jgi:hypothetical protein
MLSFVGQTKVSTVTTNEPLISKMLDLQFLLAKLRSGQLKVVGNEKVEGSRRWHMTDRPW